MKYNGVMWSFCSHYSVIFLPFLQRITSKCSPDDSSHNPSRLDEKWGKLSEMQVIFCELSNKFSSANNCRVPLNILSFHPITTAKREKAAGYPEQFLKSCSQVPLTSYFCSIDKLFCPLTYRLQKNRIFCKKMAQNGLFYKKIRVFFCKTRVFFCKTEGKRPNFTKK